MLSSSSVTRVENSKRAQHRCWLNAASLLARLSNDVRTYRALIGHSYPFECNSTHCFLNNYFGPEQSCQVRDFPAELGYFNTLSAGCFSCPRVEATPIMWYLYPGMRLLPGEPGQKKCVFYPQQYDFYQGIPWKAIGRVLLKKPGNPGPWNEWL